MKIAVPYNEGNLDQNVGIAKCYKLYSVFEGKITGAEMLNSSDKGHYAVAAQLMAYGVSVLACKDYDEDVEKAMKLAQIEIFGGFEGEADRVVEELITGKLKDDPRVLRKASSKCGSCSGCSSSGGCSGC